MRAAHMTSAVLSCVLTAAALMHVSISARAQGANESTDTKEAIEGDGPSLSERIARYLEQGMDAGEAFDAALEDYLRPDFSPQGQDCDGLLLQIETNQLTLKDFNRVVAGKQAELVTMGDLAQDAGLQRQIMSLIVAEIQDYFGVGDTVKTKADLTRKEIVRQRVESIRQQARRARELEELFAKEIVEFTALQVKSSKADAFRHGMLDILRERASEELDKYVAAMQRLGYWKGALTFASKGNLAALSLRIAGLMMQIVDAIETRALTRDVMDQYLRLQIEGRALSDTKWRDEYRARGCGDDRPTPTSTPASTLKPKGKYANGLGSATFEGEYVSVQWLVGLRARHRYRVDGDRVVFIEVATGKPAGEYIFTGECLVVPDTGNEMFCKGRDPRPKQASDP